MRNRRPSQVLVLPVLMGLLLGGPLVHAPGARAVGVWAPAAAPARDFAWTTPLQDGRVLGVAAFRAPPPSPGSAPGPWRTVTEVYDPVTDRWSARSPLPYVQGHNAPVLLPDGRVLFTGGEDNRGYTPGSRGILRAAQVYDPAADTWTPVAPMGTARHHHPAILLADGTVLVAGGDVSYGSGGPTPTAAVERYDPRTARWSPAAPLAAPRLEHTLTRLRDGRVLAAGGVTGDGQQDTLATAELYDPVADRWTAVTSMAAPRRGHTATPLADGRVLVAGGTDWESGTPSGRPEVYDPDADRWAPTGPMATIRDAFTATPLPNGQVLVAGGRGYSSGGDYPDGFYAGDELVSTELYDPAGNVWAGAAPMSVPRAHHTATPLHDGRVLVFGGNRDVTTAELYTPTPAPAACFAETDRCVHGPFLAYWQQHGGLAVNGYPLSEEFIQVLEDGRAYQVQYFERVRLEYHPDNAAPYDVLLGHFGRRIFREHTGRETDPPTTPLPGQAYFPETGHNLGEGFLQYWQNNGGLGQFGFPISEVFEQQLEDGKTYRVQYFERARFEHHPENPPPYDILLGQFGRRILAEVGRQR